MGRRPARCYRKFVKQPLPKSRFVRSCPDPKIQIFDTGNKKAGVEDLPARIDLVSDVKQLFSSECLEALRMAVNKYMIKKAGKENFHMRICPRPFHINRMNKMMTCAGADRLQTGMAHAYGKPVGTSARVMNGQSVVSIRTKDRFIPDAMEALRRGGFKIPGSPEVRKSDKHGFTKLWREEFTNYKKEGKLIFKGAQVEVIKEKGPIDTYFEKKEIAMSFQ